MAVSHLFGGTIGPRFEEAHFRIAAPLLDEDAEGAPAIAVQQYFLSLALTLRDLSDKDLGKAAEIQACLDKKDIHDSWEELRDLLHKHGITKKSLPDVKSEIQALNSDAGVQALEARAVLERFAALRGGKSHQIAGDKRPEGAALAINSQLGKNNTNANVGPVSTKISPDLLKLQTDDPEAIKDLLRGEVLDLSDTEKERVYQFVKVKGLKKLRALEAARVFSNFIAMVRAEPSERKLKLATELILVSDVNVPPEDYLILPEDCFLFARHLVTTPFAVPLRPQLRVLWRHCLSRLDASQKEELASLLTSGPVQKENKSYFEVFLGEEKRTPEEYLELYLRNRQLYDREINEYLLRQMGAEKRFYALTDEDNLGGFSWWHEFILDQKPEDSDLNVWAHLALEPSFPRRAYTAVSRLHSHTGSLSTALMEARKGRGPGDRMDERIRESGFLEPVLATEDSRDFKWLKYKGYFKDPDSIIRRVFHGSREETIARLTALFTGVGAATEAYKIVQAYMSLVPEGEWPDVLEKIQRGIPVGVLLGGWKEAVMGHEQWRLSDEFRKKAKPLGLGIVATVLERGVAEWGAAIKLLKAGVRGKKSTAAYLWHLLCAAMEDPERKKAFFEELIEANGLTSDDWYFDEMGLEEIRLWLRSAVSGLSKRQHENTYYRHEIVGLLKKLAQQCQLEGKERAALLGEIVDSFPVWPEEWISAAQDLFRPGDFQNPEISPTLRERYSRYLEQVEQHVEDPFFNSGHIAHPALKHLFEDPAVRYAHLSRVAHLKDLSLSRCVVALNIIGRLAGGLEIREPERQAILEKVKAVTGSQARTERVLGDFVRGSLRDLVPVIDASDFEGIIQWIKAKAGKSYEYMIAMEIFQAGYPDVYSSDRLDKEYLSAYDDEDSRPWLEQIYEKQIPLWKPERLEEALVRLCIENTATISLLRSQSLETVLYMIRFLPVERAEKFYKFLIGISKAFGDDKSRERWQGLLQRVESKFGLNRVQVIEEIQGRPTGALLADLMSEELMREYMVAPSSSDYPIAHRVRACKFFLLAAIDKVPGDIIEECLNLLLGRTVGMERLPFIREVHAIVPSLSPANQSVLLRLLLHYKKNTTSLVTKGQLESVLERILGLAEPQVRAHFGAADPKAFAAMTPAEMEAFIAANGLEAILAAFENDPSGLAQVLDQYHSHLFQNRPISEFLKAYVGLKVKTRVSRGASAAGSQVRQALLGEMLRAMSGMNPDLSEQAIERSARLLIRISRIDWQRDPQALVDELKATRTAQTHEFIAKVYERAWRYFEGIRQAETGVLKTKPYLYQKEGILFLKDRTKAILADETGMGKTLQVIGAVESNPGIRRVIWVTTSAARAGIAREIKEHSHVPEDQILILKEGDPQARAAQLRSLDQYKYILCNYETLREVQQKTPELYETLKSKLDLTVIDEAQFVDNPKTLRTRAVTGLDVKYKWLLSASPYQSSPETLWTLLNYLDAKRFDDFSKFKRVYAKSTEGLRRLNCVLSDYMLRRTKESTLKEFLDPEVEGFERQLSDGVPRLPRFTRLSPEESATYFDLSKDQTDLIFWMMSDFEGFADHYNERLADESTLINKDTINPLLKYSFINRAIYEPQAFGLEPSPHFLQVMDDRVGEKLDRGEKIILWTTHTAQVRDLATRYAGYGVTIVDGQVTGKKRDQAIEDFQKNPGVRVLIGNYKAGGQALTLTAATSAIGVQLPETFSALFQSEGRHHRLIGLNNIENAKNRVTAEYLIPRFHPDVMADIRDKEFRAVVEAGTLPAQKYRRLQSNEYIYNLVMEGLARIEDAESHFKVELLKAAGLVSGKKYDYASRFKGRDARYWEMAKCFEPLWRLFEGRPELQAKVLGLAESFKSHEGVAQRLWAVFRGLTGFNERDFDFIGHVFGVKNKYIREQLLEHLPAMMARAYADGSSLSDVSAGLHLHRLSPLSYIAQILMRFLPSASSPLLGISRELESLQADTKVKEALEEHFFAGVFGLMRRDPQVEALGRLDLSSLDLVDQVRTVYRLGLLARLGVDIPVEGSPDVSEMKAWIEDVSWKSLAEFLERDESAIREAFSRLGPARDKSIDPLLALRAGWIENDQAGTVDQLQEILKSVVDGDYAQKKLTGGFTTGAAIDFLEEAEDFWKEFVQADETVFEVSARDHTEQGSSLWEDYQTLVSAFNQEHWLAEGDWVRTAVTLLREKGRAYKAELSEAKKRLAAFPKSPGELTEGQRQLMTDHGVLDTSNETFPFKVREALQKIQNALNWGHLDEIMGQVKEGNVAQKDTALRVLSAKSNHYRAHNFDDMANQMDFLAARLKNLEGPVKERKVRVVDTDDPLYVARMGALHQELMTCMNPNGNPGFTQFITNMMGSKNMKLVMAFDDEKDEILAVARVKVKKDAEESPVLFLERGYYRQGMDLTDEMLTHLQLKSSRIKETTDVTAEVMTDTRDPKAEDPVVRGIGAFDPNEYVGSVFGFRQAGKVEHRGVRVAPSRIKTHRVIRTTTRATAARGGAGAVRGLEIQDQTIPFSMGNFMPGSAAVLMGMARAGI